MRMIYQNDSKGEKVALNLNKKSTYMCSKYSCTERALMTTENSNIEYEPGDNTGGVTE